MSKLREAIRKIILENSDPKVEEKALKFLDLTSEIAFRCAQLAILVKDPDFAEVKDLLFAGRMKAVSGQVYKFLDQLPKEPGKLEELGNLLRKLNTMLRDGKLEG